MKMQMQKVIRPRSIKNLIKNINLILMHFNFENRVERVCFGCTKFSRAMDVTMTVSYYYKLQKFFKNETIYKHYNLTLK